MKETCPFVNLFHASFTLDGLRGQTDQRITTNTSTSCIQLHTYISFLLTPCSRVLEKLTGCQLVQKFPSFYVNSRFITVLTRIHHLSLSWPRSIQSIPPSHPTYGISVLILSSRLRLGLPSGHFPSGFPTKTLYTPLLSPIRATCPAHFILLDFITRTIFDEQYRSLSSSLCSLLHSSVTPSLLGPNIPVSTLLSNTLSLCSSLNVSDHVSHPYKTTGAIVVHTFTQNIIPSIHRKRWRSRKF